MADDSYELELDFYDDDDSDIQENGAQSKKQRGSAKSWSKEKEFESRLDALQFIKRENCWSISNKNKTSDGDKVYFRCNKVKKASEQCPSGIYLLYHADRESVSLFRATADHVHDRNLSNRGLDQNTRAIVKQLYNDGIKKPKQILSALQARGIQEPPIRSLKNFLHTYKQEKLGPPSITPTELDEWCAQRSIPPLDQLDKAYVVNYTIDQDGDGNVRVRIFMSTPRLLQYGLKSDILHADATYKLNWNGFPAFVIGTSDRDRHFFPIGIGVCTSEKSEDFAFIFQGVAHGILQVSNKNYWPNILIADASDAITNGFILAFGDHFKRIMCWAHAIRAIDKKLEKIKDKPKQKQIRMDIYELQLCPSEVVFNAVSNLFLSKWSQENSYEIDEFLAYFNSEWLMGHKNWYEGYAVDTPSTNNGLEAMNNVIKMEQKLRERLPLRQFMELIENKILVQWSLERDGSSVNSKMFAELPTPTTDVWTNAYEWASLSKPLLSKRFEYGYTNYFIPSANTNAFSPLILNSYRTSFSMLEWDSFDDYKKMRNSIWVVEMYKDQWRNANCTCRLFFKEFLCKHILGIAIRKHFCKPPDVSKNLAIGQKRKRG